MNRRRLTKRAKENPRQDEFDVPAIDQSAGFIYHQFDRFTPQLRAQMRDDAVSAMRITSILDLEKRALMPRLVLLT